ncbi:N-lysine methyltransferase SETD8-B-like, partial [Poecilia latipinna]|uniref:N-lysine methyltransferase SETD8-B-like n=1 Tax=Poecilia latipinna TaxID=48699 RepID=UPI00072E7F4F
KLFDKWRSAQLKLRRRHLMTKWRKEKPTLDQVQRCLSRSKWNKNCVPAGDVVRLWAPPLPTGQEETDVARYVSEQSWAGLVVAQSQRPGAGRGVFATRDFSKGSVLCDYHGRLVSARQGRRILANLKEAEGCYVFFFKLAEQNLCVDAQPEHCCCHPDIPTFGRLVNHSAKSSNSKCVVANRPGLGQPTVLITATRDIAAGEEVLMDYGVRRRSFGGEGMDLFWLDE